MTSIKRKKNLSIFFMEIKPYRNTSILSENTGNNAFAWEKRKEYHNKEFPSLTIPSLID